MPRGHFFVTHPKLPKIMKSLQKVQNVNSDSSQEGHLLIWGHFPAQNSCQSLKVWVSHLNFCQLARQAALPEFKIEVWNSLNFWQIHHFEGLGNIWTGFVLPNLVPDWNFGTFELLEFGNLGWCFFEVGAPLRLITTFQSRVGVVAKGGKLVFRPFLHHVTSQKRWIPFFLWSKRPLSPS